MSQNKLITRYLGLIYQAGKVRLGFLIMACALAGIAVSPSSNLNGLEIFALAVYVLVASSTSGAFNQWYERDIDAIMERTNDRPFVTKELSPTNTFTSTNWFSLDGNYAADWVLNINSTTILYEPEGEDFDQIQALRNTVNKMMELADVGIVISLLSTVAIDAYDESFLTFDPIETLDWALNEFGAQGGNVKLDHSISDAVFILTIYK